MMAPKTSKIEHKPLPIVLSGMSQHDTPTQPDAFCAEAFAHEPIQNPERHRWGRAVPSGHAPAIDLVGPRITIGRRNTCTIQLQEAVVSGVHCALDFAMVSDQPTVLVSDLSSNGTYLIVGHETVKLEKHTPPDFKRRLITSGTEIVIIQATPERHKVSFVIYIDEWPPQIQLTHGPHLKYDLRELLGSGSFAKVQLCIDKNTGHRYACKIVDKQKLKLKQALPNERPDALLNEVMILQQLDHQNIIRIYECFETESSLFLILELVEGGELYDRIIKVGKFSEAEALFIFRQIYLAVNYMHRQGIIHRDLKPENILMVNHHENRIKLSDFGLSRQISVKSRAKTLCGTPQYLAPEVSFQNSQSTGYGEAVDIWSLGVILYILLCGYPPFNEDLDIELKDQMARGMYSFPPEPWSSISAEAKDLVTRMLTPRSDMRIQTNAIATHPWMSVKSVQLPSTLTKATLALALSPTAPEQSVPAKRIRLNAAVDASAAPSTSAPAAPVFASPRPPNQQHAERRAQEQQSPAIVGVQSVGKRKAEAQPDSSSQ